MPTIPFKDLAVRNIKSAGRYGFGRGHYSLCIQAEVDSTGTLRKRWEQRIRIKGCSKRNDFGLGPYPLIQHGRCQQRGQGKREARGDRHSTHANTLASIPCVPHHSGDGR